MIFLHTKQEKKKKRKKNGKVGLNFNPGCGLCTGLWLGGLTGQKPTKDYESSKMNQKEKYIEGFCTESVVGSGLP